MICNSLFYSLRYELSKIVLKYKLTYQDKELCIRKGIYPIEYPKVPNIQTWIDPIFSSITPSCYIPN